MGHSRSPQTIMVECGLAHGVKARSIKAYIIYRTKRSMCFLSPILENGPSHTAQSTTHSGSAGRTAFGIMLVARSFKLLFRRRDAMTLYICKLLQRIVLEDFGFRLGGMACIDSRMEFGH